MLVWELLVTLGFFVVAWFIGRSYGYTDGYDAGRTDGFNSANALLQEAFTRILEEANDEKK